MATRSMMGAEERILGIRESIPLTEPQSWDQFNFIYTDIEFQLDLHSTLMENQGWGQVPWIPPSQLLGGVGMVQLVFVLFRCQPRLEPKIFQFWARCTGGGTLAALFQCVCWGWGRREFKLFPPFPFPMKVFWASKVQ